MRGFMSLEEGTKEEKAVLILSEVEDGIVT